MATATLRVAKIMLRKARNAKENPKVCIFCDTVEFLALMIFPILVPVFIIWTY